MAKDDALKRLAAKAASGVQVFPEDAKHALVESGVKPEEFADLIGTTSTETVEWQDPSTRNHRYPQTAPESLVNAEAQGLADVEKIDAVSESVGTDTNDPDKSLMAAGPAGDVAGVGFSGQVVDAAEYDTAGDKAEKATAKASK